MISKQNNFAYIDGANLYSGIKELGWKLDYGRFRIWLTEKYGVSRAYLFIGLVAKYKDLYTYLQEVGFTPTPECYGRKPVDEWLSSSRSEKRPMPHS